MSELGICGRCLVIVNTVTVVTARAGGNVVSIAPNPTSPRALLTWAEEQLYGNNAQLFIDDQADTFRPVTTWHGDPVCPGHLTECRLREFGIRQ